MYPDMKKLSLGRYEKIENLFNIIRPVGYSTHYFQQACISNLLVTVFAGTFVINYESMKNSKHHTILCR
jgi:hypothetical protein